PLDAPRVDVHRRTEHRQARPADRLLADRGAHAGLAALEQLVCLIHGGCLLLLAFLAEDVFGVVLDALALVGLRRAHGADLGRDLADLLLVVAADQHRGRLLALDRDAFRDRIQHVVAVAHLQLQVLALDRGAIADAVDLQRLAVALAHALDHVAQVGAGGAPQDAGLGVPLERLHPHLAVLHGHVDLLGDRQLQRAELALHGRDAAGDVDRDALRDGDRVLAYAGHLVPLRTRGTALRRRHSPSARRSPTSRPAGSTGSKYRAR